ncbi:PAS domain S-box protein [Aliifodinibius sp. S!AR15-10]|uniref:sensor histidine kinase n=1 Tax=Aliifodinibius sp. S!AR15-10 TaxID=2950437 RepID=UPI00285657BB|nr:histidine kinase dimerization/phosphoacceptor domain -containing protein [Aliifodinibius sp. S!AR15-10]MDR8393859.1 PAS domain S-box protein [Aliifodinibius sp. S!AR15-10]
MNFNLSSSPPRIFLNLSNPTEEQMVRRFFPDNYEFDLASDHVTSNHDLGIVNIKYLKKNNSDLSLLKNDLEPLFLPLVLVGRETVIDRVNANDWNILDDFFPTPVSANIFKIRVKSLLNLRQKSIKLNRENNLSHKAINAIEAGIVITDATKDDNPITFSNKGFKKMTGYKHEEVIGKNCRFLQKNDRDQKALQKIRGAIAESRHEKVILRNYRKDGSLFWNELSISPIKDCDGKNEYFVGVQNDVTDLIKARDKLEGLVEEKETLLKEVHHRIKNNLAVIVALLELKILNIADPKIVETLHETKNRIFSIAKVHELLYEHNNLHSIRFDIYIEKLTTHLRETYRSNEKNIEFRLSLEQATLNLNQAVPCGMLLSELITNSIKHAFNHKNEGKITISLAESDGTFYLSVKDTGDGVVNDSDIDTLLVLEDSIINTLLKQLGAEWNIEAEKGLTFSFHFEPGSYTGPSNEL